MKTEAPISVLMFFISLSNVNQVTFALPNIIRIGGLFDKGDVKQEVAFRYAIESINSAKSIFYKSRSRLEPMIEKIPTHNSFHASKRVCHLMRSGVAAIFGPQSSRTSSHVQSICDTLEIPHVETRWDYRLRRDDYSVNLHPHPSSLSRAFYELVRHFKWKTVLILYENNNGLTRLQEILKHSSLSNFYATIRQLPQTGNYRPVLRDAKGAGLMNIILDCATENIVDVLTQAQQIGMMTPENNYILTSLDSYLLDLEPFKYGGSNITTVRIIDKENPDTWKILSDIRVATARFTGSRYPHDLLIGTSAALMYDAVQLFAKAIQALDNSTDVVVTPLLCDGVHSWDQGFSLINYMKMVNTSGLTGVVEFDSLGFRTNFRLDILELVDEGFTKVGTWSTRIGANYTREVESSQNSSIDGLRNKTLIVSFAFNDPYIMLKESKQPLIGNNRYEGYCVDLLEAIAEILGFNYTLVPVPGNAYGSRNSETNEWNGMIRELLDERADMAITDLTINYEREEAVDFTMPFMNMGITILYKKPRKMAPSLFSFLSPLSLEVWIYMMAALVGVSVLMYIMARFTPYEWQNPHPCDPDPDMLENQFTLLNCLWFSIGSLMQQGCDFLPQALSTRMVAGMWWFFTLIMISSYTANLAAFLTVEQMESPIESVEDLAAQTKIKYGCLASGTTAAFFRDSNLSTYITMWEHMNEAVPSVFVSSNSEGIERVQTSNGLYAYLSESTSIEYVTERKCDLRQVGGLLDSKSYGIALPTGSSYKDALDVVILNLQERGRMYFLKEKWWRQRRGGGRCKEESSGSSMASELNLSNVGGVFVVLLGGMGMALIVAIFEFLFEIRELAQEDDIPFLEVLAEELQFVFKCKGSSKPVKKKFSEVGIGDEESEVKLGELYASNEYNMANNILFA